jgi:hypothetical protein
MALNATRQEILDILKARREIVLAGNKENYSYVRRVGRLWIRTDGDPMTGEEDETQLSDEEVLRALYWKARERLGHYGPDDGAVTWDDVLAWWREGGY